MSLDHDIARLAALPLLGGLSPEALRLIAFTSRKRRLTTGETLHRRGDALDGAVALLEGALELSGVGEARRRVEAPAAVAELALFIETQAGATAQALGEAVTMPISRETMRRVLEEFPQDAAMVRDRLAADLARFARDARHAAEAVGL